VKDIFDLVRLIVRLDYCQIGALLHFTKNARTRLQYKNTHYDYYTVVEGTNMLELIRVLGESKYLLHSLAGGKINDIHSLSLFGVQPAVSGGQ
jgi:hypothetical protein